jgi:hypothetical protein
MKRGVEKKKIFSKTSKILFCFLIFVILASVFVFSTTSISDSLISSVNSTFSGFVGIGTLTPSTTLDVRGIGNFSGTIYINNHTDISTNWTNLAVLEMSANDTLINSSVTKLYTINSTVNIQTLLITTNISQYAFNQSYSLLQMQNMYNVTVSTIANLTFLQNFTTLGVQGLYNVTSSMIANLTFLQNFTLGAVQALINNSNIGFGTLNATNFSTTGNVAHILSNVYNFSITVGAIPVFFVNSTNVAVNNSLTISSNGNVNVTAFNSSLIIGGIGATLVLNNAPANLPVCNTMINHSLDTNASGLYYCASNSTWVQIVPN